MMIGKREVGGLILGALSAIISYKAEANLTSRVLHLPQKEDYPDVMNLSISPQGDLVALIREWGSSIEIVRPNEPVFPSAASFQRLGRVGHTAEGSIGFLSEHLLATPASNDAPPGTILSVFDLTGTRQRMDLSCNTRDAAADAKSLPTFVISGDRSTIAALCGDIIDRVILVIRSSNYKTEQLSFRQICKTTDAILHISISQDGGMILLGGAIGIVYAIDRATRRLLNKMTVFSRAILVGVNTIAVSPNAKYVAVGPTARMSGGVRSPDPGISDDYAVKLLHSDGRMSIIKSLSGPTHNLAWSPNSELLAISEDRRLTIVSVSNRNVVVVFPQYASHAMAFAPNGQSFTWVSGTTMTTTDKL